MNLVLKQKLMLMPLKRFGMPIAEAQMERIGVGFGGQLQQVRRHAPIVGPPRFRFSMAQKAILGWGPLLFMMIIPIWTVCSIPRWSALHNNLPWDEDEPKQPKEEQ